MKKEECLRCGLEFESQDESQELCSECNTLTKQALELIENDPKVAEYYQSIVREQEKAEARLDFIYNGKDKTKLLKNIGKGIKKAYQFSVLDLAVAAVKKIMLKNEPKKTEQELLFEEIADIKKFISIDPLEFVIHKYLAKDEEPETEKGKRNFIVELIDELIISRFVQLDEKKKYNIAMAFIVVITLLSILIILL